MLHLSANRIFRILKVRRCWRKIKKRSSRHKSHSLNCMSSYHTSNTSAKDSLHPRRQRNQPKPRLRYCYGTNVRTCSRSGVCCRNRVTKCSLRAINTPPDARSETLQQRCFTKQEVLTSVERCTHTSSNSHAPEPCFNYPSLPSYIFLIRNMLSFLRFNAMFRAA